MILDKYRKKRMAEKAKRERRKKIYGKDLLTEKPKPIQTVMPQKVEESPPVDDDPNEVMGKSNIIYYNDIGFRLFRKQILTVYFLTPFTLGFFCHSFLSVLP